MGYLPAGLTMLLGPHGSGKTAFAEQLLGVDPSMVVTVDDVRGRNAAHQVVESRLRAGLPVLVDETNLGRERLGWHRLARRFGAPVSVVRFSLDEKTLRVKNTERLDPLPAHELDTELSRYRQITDRQLFDEGATVVLNAADVLAMMPVNFHGTHLTGPFDIIGDVHGQREALEQLLETLGYRSDGTHPDGRIPVFVGDIVDKGPDPVGTLELVMERHRQGRALMVLGNHEFHLRKVLARAAASDDPAGTLKAEARQAREPRRRTLLALADRTDLAEARYSTLRRWLARIPMHLQLHGGELAVVHAAAHRDLLGREPVSPADRREMERWFLWGPHTGRKTVDGHPERVDWVDTWDSPTTVVRGHVTVAMPEVRNNVVSTDTGAGDGKTLTAWSWPEREFTSVTC